MSKLPYSVLKKLVHSGPLNEVSVILFTSGSEKEPKAVQLSHRNILQNVDAVPKLVTLDHNDVYMSILPMFHVFGLTTQFWLPALMGATMVTYPNPLEYKTVSDCTEYKATVMAASFSITAICKSQSPGISAL
jgi:acyl-[acyl-carrier-protein]-phospholipid O-acyltransferase/long-chain-fatty-acid--[acyl-carrier-protein] ligase